MSIVLGIDPGKSGGFALVNVYPAYENDLNSTPFIDRNLLTTGSMSKGTPYDVSCKIAEFAQQADFVVIEQVGGHIGIKQTGASMFTFGWWTGMAHTAASLGNSDVRQIIPQKWQSDIGFPGGTKKLCGNFWKKRLFLKAKELYPKYKFSQQVADAVLIATWGSEHSNYYEQKNTAPIRKKTPKVKSTLKTTSSTSCP